MPLPHRLRPALARGLAPALLLAACAVAADPRDAPVLRAAAGAPGRFELEDPAARLAPADTFAGTGCRSPMVDPRDGTRVRFVRTNPTFGDYEVPAGRYGVGPGELLRLECNTGRVLGVVQQ